MGPHIEEFYRSENKVWKQRVYQFNKSFLKMKWASFKRSESPGKGVIYTTDL